jgi:adenylate cyclase
MSGESREMTVLFADIRDFTTLSESMNPRQLTQFMNEIFTFLTQIIYKHRGTIDKYIGDEIMAFWGAPLTDEHHAHHALEATLEMIAELPNLHKRLKKQNWPPIEIGIGVNTGTMSVGNMGSEYRMAYTVLGDAVNLGARISALTKVYHTPIIVSDFTQKKVEGIVFQEIDRVRVKGKAESVTIVTPLDILTNTGIITLEDRDGFINALTHYRNQQWHIAEQEFMKLKEHSVNPKLYSVFLHRIHQFSSHPPEENWDGVFIF